MAEISPFQGIRYNQQAIGDLASVICPPYDIISPLMQEELYRNSEYNFVRIEYNRELPQDNSEDNRYTRSATYIRQWLTQGILKAENEPSLYVHQHHFVSQGKRYKRDNIIARVRLEDWDKKIIRPHENVMPKPKSDRLNMLRACQANTSAVLALYEDPQRTISFLLTAQEVNHPLINIVDSDGDRHKLWKIDAPDVIRKIQKTLERQPLYIADGHHRYDSALTYSREKSVRSENLSGEESYNYVMMSLVDFADPGLVILPPHRLVRGISRSVLGSLKSQLSIFFDIQELPLNSQDLWQKMDEHLTGMHPDMEQIRMGLIGLEPDKALILTLRDFEAASRLMPPFHGDLYKKLDVSLVDHLVLEKVLGFNKEKEDISLAYYYDREDALERIKNEEYQLLFILNPLKPEIIKAIADEGDRMPRKSTYFYPKSPAGLVFYRW